MKKRSFRHTLYAILDLDLPYLKKGPLLVARELINGGADVVQLRSKLLSDRKFIEIGIKIREVVKKNNRIFIINDRVDIAKAIDTDGVHLGREDFPIDLARKVLGVDKIIGFSVHKFSELKKILDYDIDYISVGPIFRSPTKPFLKPVGIKFLKRIVSMNRLPIVAIGGINLDNLGEVLSTGVDSIAVISAILKSKEITKTASIFKTRIISFSMDKK